MKQLIEKYLGWLKDSNRPKHMKAGMLVFLAMLAVCLTLGVKFNPSTVISFVVTAIVAIAVDYKDKLYGNTFDWLDVLATVLIPGVMTIAILILYTCIL